MSTIFTELNSDNNSEISNFNLFISNNPDIKNISKNNGFIDNLSAAPEFNQIEEKFDSKINNKTPNYNDVDNIIKMIKKGLIPLFIKMEEYKPIFFFCNKKTKLKKIINTYAKMHDIKNISNYSFFKGNEELNVNLTIEDSNIKNFEVIRSVLLKEQKIYDEKIKLFIEL